MYDIEIMIKQNKPTYGMIKFQINNNDDLLKMLNTIKSISGCQQDAIEQVINYIKGE